MGQRLFVECFDERGRRSVSGRPGLPIGEAIGMEIPMSELNIPEIYSRQTPASIPCRVDATVGFVSASKNRRVHVLFGDSVETLQKCSCLILFCPGSI
jgi:hypothetical protein